MSTSTDSIILPGTSNNDVLLGGSGGDTVTTGSGTDVVVAYGGDDTIAIDGAGNKTVDGGTGTDSLTISYTGITGLTDFTASKDGDYVVLTDAAGNAIRYKNIEALVIGSTSYAEIYAGRSSSTSSTVSTAEYSNPADFKVGGRDRIGGFHNNVISSAFYSSADGFVQLYPFNAEQGSNFTIPALQTFGWDRSSALLIQGTPYNDTVSDRNESSHTAPLTINTYAGTDIIALTESGGADTVDAGDGDDFVYVSARSPNQFTNDVSLNGGAGVDWLVIRSFSSDSVNYTINTGNTSGFENVLVGFGNDTLTGDSNDNILQGWGGADKLYGLEGNDSLYGYVYINGQGVSNEGSDYLYGGPGDDVLAGGAGADWLDGGKGKDVLSGEGLTDDGTGALTADEYARGGPNGADTFVTRDGDGGPSVDLADVIMDFEDGSDLIGLEGLNHGQLTITQGQDDYVNDVIVRILSTGEYLFVIKNQQLVNITDLDFEGV